MSYERQNGHNGGVPDQGLGATTGLKLTTAVLPGGAHPAGVAASLPAAQGGSPVGTVLVLGGLGLGAFLLYRHFKKKGAGGSAPPSAP